MSNTYSQIYIQIVFAVKNRKALIHSSWEEKLYKYITGIVTQKHQKLIAINGMPDHIHIFIGIKPDCSVSDLVREIKKSSTNYINTEKLSTYKFNWQEGFGAFSYGHSQIDAVYHYILNQKKHHRTKSFKEEYLDFLEKFKVDYKSEYLFDWLEAN
ncbi:MAG: IS200/IS605 family transposase [Winogradskyella sp.]|uniref:IS200/IS605 family transposase n=1 Tax=Winogradskyella sp. TaxID=1883156 RepID=UPI00385DAD56